MESDPAENQDMSLAEERLRLEREALAVERERLAAARAHADAEAQIARTRRTMPIAATITLLVMLSFAGGVFTGFAIMESRQNAQREARLAQALSQLGPLAVPTQETGTNGVGAVRRDVSVVVIQ